MLRSIPARAAFVALFLATATSAGASKTCVSGTDPLVDGDRSAIASVRAAIDVACPCATFDGSSGKSRSDYLRCIADVVAAQLDTASPPGPLRRQCRSLVQKIYTRSTCGSPASEQVQPCVKRLVTGAKVSCSIKPGTACIDGATFTQKSCPAYTTCLDAADSNEDFVISASGDDGNCVAPPCSTCVNIPYSSPYNGLDCTSYETGGVNSAYCLDDGARVACCACDGGVRSCP